MSAPTADDALGALAVEVDYKLRRSAVMIASGLDMQFSTLRREIDVGFNRIQMRRSGWDRWALGLSPGATYEHR